MFGSDSDAGGRAVQSTPGEWAVAEEEQYDEERGNSKKRRQDEGGYLSPQEEVFDEEDEGPGPSRDEGEEMHIEAPLLNIPPKEKLHLLKLTNIIGIQTKPFDPETFQKEEEVYIDERGHERVRIRDSNVIRWRWATGPKGEPVKESNARFVKWSDGSMQLLLGDEVLDVKTQDISKDNMYLYAVHGIIQGQSQLVSKMALVPASLNSKIHRRLREMVGKKHAKMTKISVHAAIHDPEAMKAELEKKEQERIKERESIYRRQERVMTKYRPPPQRSAHQLTSDFLEEELDEGYPAMDEEEEDIGRRGAVAGRTRHSLDRGRSSGLYRPRPLDDEEEEEAARRLQSAKRHVQPLQDTPTKRRRPVDEDEEEGGTGLASEDEGDRGRGIKAKVRRGVVLSDDEDSY